MVYITYVYVSWYGVQYVRVLVCVCVCVCMFFVWCVYLCTV